MKPAEWRDETVRDTATRSESDLFDTIFTKTILEQLLGVINCNLEIRFKEYHDSIQKRNKKRKTENENKSPEQRKKPMEPSDAYRFLPATSDDVIALIAVFLYIGNTYSDEHAEV